MFEIREVFDPGVQVWSEISRDRRPDLDAKFAKHNSDVAVLLFGDESRQEIEENIAVGLDDTGWFARREPVNWDAINKGLRDRDEIRRRAARGLTVFTKP